MMIDSSAWRRLRRVSGSRLLVAGCLCVGYLAGTAHASDIRQIYAFDFSQHRDGDRWERKGGWWAVRQSAYIGTAPIVNPDPCSWGSASLIKGARAKNLDIEADILSIERVDKIIVLRGQDECNQINVDFRAAGFNDVLVQEVAGGVFRYLVPPFQVFAPHELAQPIRVRLRLVGDHLTIWRRSFDSGEEELVLDQDFDFAVRELGAVGVGVINFGTTAFDNVVVKVLED